MRLETLEIENFRCFRERTALSLDDITALIGKNDAGKSSILEALEIFFNNDQVKIDARDACVHTTTSRVEIICEFSDLPESLSLDAGATTTLEHEYLLTESGRLRVCKIYDCSKNKPGCEVAIEAVHPTAKGVDNLLEAKESDLQTMVKERALDVKLKGNPGMRRAIWDSAGDLALSRTRLLVTKPREDSRRIWEQLEAHLPMFALFQSDRRSQDSDGEVQNPMKAAVAAAISEVQSEIEQIHRKVEERTRQIATSTHQALASLDPSLANDLAPDFSHPTVSKWVNLFSVNMVTDHGIPLNKRGSGIRRLVLISFFKAEAERVLETTSRRSIIYAVEEPETAQHPNNQRVLLAALSDIASEPGCQVLLTTHNPGVAAELPADSIRYVRERNGSPAVEAGADVYEDIATALGVTPDSRVRVLICVEGPTDVAALKSLSSALSCRDPGIVDVSTDKRIAFVTLGGSTLQHWVANHYLRDLGRPEVHIPANDSRANRR